jgi:hypothetical protein
MYVDSAREADLRELKAVRDDPAQPMSDRRRASKAFDKILSQLKDPKLAAMRERLMKATYAADLPETWKITNQIKDYLGEEIFIEGKDYGRT